MTISQINELLAAGDAAHKLIAALKADKRAAVARLVDKWHKRQAAVCEEQQRLEQLHRHEQSFHEKGCRLVAGIDEAGRGPLAGPVVVGAVILPCDCRLSGLNDSKKLSVRQRRELYYRIKESAIAVHHVIIDETTIEQINIYQATMKGMYEAAAGLKPLPDAVLVDAMPLRYLKIPCLSLIHGDQLSASIAAASVIAKVERDRLMDELDRQYPHYGFAKHKGYATPEHLEALETYGPCPIHRKSFAPVKTWGTLFDEDY
jgi:ribonuclease HII